MSADNKTEVSPESSPKPRTSIWPQVVLKDGYVRIPNRLVWGASLLKLRAPDFLVLVYLLSRAFEKASAYPSIETISQETGLSTSTVVRSVHRLRKVYVRVTMSDWGTNEYSFWPLVEALENLGPVQRHRRKKVRSERKPAPPEPLHLTDSEVLEAVRKVYPALPAEYRELVPEAANLPDEGIWQMAVNAARPTLEARSSLCSPVLSFIINDMSSARTGVA